MIIRKAMVADAAALSRLHERSVRELCSEHYSPEQLHVWVNKSTEEVYQTRLKKHRSYIAECDGNMVGFVRWNPASNELCSIYIDPDYVRQGIATKLMNRACEDAESLGVTKLWLDASLTAVPFYDTIGWENIKRTKHGILPCVRMIKRLHPG